MPLQVGGWRTSESYRFAIDLFNRGFYWEAHEAWEEVWVACGRRGLTADTLKALIKLAAAAVKARQGNSAGMKRHAARAAELFGSVLKAASGSVSPRQQLGLPIDELEQFALSLAEAPDLVADVGDPSAYRLGLQLRPKG